ncbi:MAG: precorrin-3B synthase, partial [Propionibacteriaceae bacterium]|nr:precorrin-3B synthase [Propionibacteriaceae bacterium]
ATIRAATGPHLPVPLGVIGEAASVAVPLGLLDARQVRAIERAASGGRIVITPWRGVVIPGGAAALDALAETALVTDEESAWSRLTACIGAPSCANSRINTRELAGELVDHLRAATLQPVHLSGCERRCGAPAGRHIDLVAPDCIGRALAEIERSQ